MIGQTTFQVTGRLNADGEPALKVTAFCDYGSRTVSVSHDVTDEKLLSQAATLFKKAIADAREDLTQQAFAAAAEAVTVAAKRGEKL